MPRRPRLFLPGCVYHVMTRGIDGNDIFEDDKDRELLLDLFEKYSQKTGIRCYAWALMRNHYHFIIRASEHPLSALMKPLNSRYASFSNKKRGRRGYLFQDRFKSIATQDQLYLEEMVRYVHLNPVRAGVCSGLEELERYRWCGHGALMGSMQSRFQDTATVLGRFGSAKEKARRAYRDFLQQGLEVAESEMVNLLRSSSTGKSDRAEPGMWVIGDKEFVKQAATRDQERRLRVARYAVEGWDMQRICTLVCGRLNVEPDGILKRGRENAHSHARKIVAYLAHRQMEIPVSEIARYFGVGQPAVSMMLDKGERLAEQNRIALTD